MKEISQYDLHGLHRDMTDDFEFEVGRHRSSADSQAAPIEAEANLQIFGLADVFQTVWLGRYLICAVTICAIAAGAAYISLREPTYTSEAHLVFQPVYGTVDGGDLSNPDGVSVLTFSGRNIFADLYQSDRIGGSVVDELGLLDDPEFNEFISSDDKSILSSLKEFGRRLLGIERNISSEQIRSSTITSLFANVRFIPATERGDVVLISATSKDREKSAAIANMMAAVIVAQRRDARIESAQISMERLIQHVDTMKAQSESDERNLQEFMTTFETLGETDLEVLSFEAGRTKARLDRAKNEEGTLSGLAEDNASDSLTESQLTAQERLEGQRRLIEALEQSLASARARIDRVSEALRRVRQLRIAADASAATYDVALRRVQENMILSLTQDPGVRVEVRAVPPIGADGLGATRFLYLIAVLGAFLGVGVVIVRELLRRRPIRVSEIERFVQPIKTIPVPRLKRASPRAPFEEKVLLETLVGTTDYAEAIRKVRASILKGNPQDSQVVVGLSSLGQADPSQPTHAIALALSCMRVGARVLVIDADIQNEAMSFLVDPAEAKGGLRVALLTKASIKSVTHKLAKLGVDLLPAGSGSEVAGDLIATPHFKQLITEARERYDIVVVNAPPISGTADAALVMRETTHRILVTRLRSASFNEIASAVSALAAGTSSRSLVMVSGVGNKDL